MNTLLVIAGLFYFVKTVLLGHRSVLRRLADDPKAAIKFLYHEQRTHFTIYPASLSPF
jgi:hypothetical protein